MIDYGIQHWDHVIAWEVWKIERKPLRRLETPLDHDKMYAHERGDWI